MTDELQGARHAKFVIVGSGFSGLGMAHALREDGEDDVSILERSTAVGGVWQLNTYPGCNCDVASNLYSFSFAPNPEWTSTYSPGSEIRDYLAECVTRFGLEDSIEFGTELTGATWNDEDHLWHLATNRGRWTAQVLISALGPLTEPKLPDVPGLEKFAGKVMHSARWDHDFDLAGKAVASIGTGASAIQYVPEIADRVGSLLVLQRTAPWVMPHDKRPTTHKERDRYRRRPWTQRVGRLRVYLSREPLILAFVTQPRLMKLVQRLPLAHLRRQVRDEQLRGLLVPDYTLGCKRILPSNRWYPALQKPTVTLVPYGLAEIRENSIVDTAGAEHEVDTIIFGTGFHVTDFPFADRIRGHDGQFLSEAWRDSPRAYLGSTVPGFPNFFLMLGPNTALGHSSMIYMIESQIAHVRRAVRELRGRNARVIEVTREAHDAYNSRIDRRMRTTVWQLGGCSSFYQDAGGRNAAIWPGWTFRFRALSRRWRPAAYRIS